MIISIGVDPGATGAFVVLEDGKFKKVIDYCFLEDLYNFGIGTVYQYPSNTIISIAIEHQQPYTGQGIKSMFSLGEKYGEVMAIGRLIHAKAMHTVIIETPRPQEWQRYIFGSGAIGSPKERSLARARQLFPDLPLIPDGCRAPRHGRSDAALIAKWAWAKAKQKIDSENKT